MNFHFRLFFVFDPKISFALGQKCYVRNWTVTKFCDIGTGDHFRFSAENGISFSSAFSLQPKMKNAFSVGMYMKLFQINYTLRRWFSNSLLNNPSSGQPVGASKN